MFRVLFESLLPGVYACIESDARLVSSEITREILPGLAPETSISDREALAGTTRLASSQNRFAEFDVELES